MENITLEKTKVLQAFNETTEENKQLLATMFGKEVFNQKVTDRIKTWEDVLKANGHTQESYDKWCEGLDENDKDHRNNKLITAALNENWIPNWSDSNEPKFRLWLKYTAGSGFSLHAVDCANAGTHVGSRLYFKTDALARYAWSQFGHILVRYYQS